MAEVTPKAADSDRPAIILDVDGVLRVDTETKPEGYVRHPLYPMFSYDPGLRGPLGSLLEQADGYYISLWREHSHDHGGEVLLLPELDWINDDEFWPAGGEISERALAIDSLFGARPVAWVDDEIDDRDRQWAAGREASTLLIKPDFETGLRIEHIATVESWLADQ